jgi:hypothetical protein
MNDIMICLDLLWMLATASIALAIIGIFNSIWNDLLG